MNKINIKGLNLAELESFVTSLSEKTYRAQQIFKWIYSKGVNSFDEMTNLSKALRIKLAAHAQISKLTLLATRQSMKDNTHKFLLQLEDGFKIESVLMFDRQRTTLCVSTQVGCAIDCKFCATGRMGLRRDLTAGEIVDQLLTVQALTGETISHVVCMGMGEPFHNYDNVMKACALLSNDLGANLAKRRIVISTSGIVPKIIRYADEDHKYRLAISLNATTDKIRNQIMPLNKKWPLKELLQAVRYYTHKTGQRVTFEYALMVGINDSLEDAERLKKLVDGVRCKINLIPYNVTTGKYRRPSEEQIAQFYKKMAGLQVPVTIRWSKGDDIAAACGQLAVRS